MDQVSAGKATRDGARTRRRRMREQARSQHAAPSPATDRYQTPEWLDRSFVLPLSSAGGERRAEPVLSPTTTTTRATPASRA